MDQSGHIVWCDALGASSADGETTAALEFGPFDPLYRARILRRFPPGAFAAL
jgi:hypothetical protein